MNIKETSKKRTTELNREFSKEKYKWLTTFKKCSTS